MKDLKRFLTSLHEKGIHLFVEKGELKSNAKLGAITSEIGKKIKQNKLEIIRFLEQIHGSERQGGKIKKATNITSYPLSFAQLRLWLLDKIDGGSSHYNMPTALKLNGDLNVEALKAAFSTIVERHEALRTYFVASQSEQPIQVVQAPDGFAVTVIDLSDLEGEVQAAALKQHVGEDVTGIFDLSADFMLRVTLLRLDEQQYILLATMHHIASDGWSKGLMVNEFTTLYGAYSKGLANPLPPLELQYTDYSQWQRNWLRDDVLDKQLDYWSRHLADLPMVHSLPLEGARPPVQTFNGDDHYSVIKQHNAQALVELCQSHGATLFMGLNAAICTLLARYSNQTDIVLGTPIANREQAEITPLIGFFMNSLVLRMDLSNDPSFNQLLAQSKGMLLDAYAHQQVPFEQIVEKLQPERSLSYTPLYQMMLILHNIEQGEGELPGLTLESIQNQDSDAKYDLIFHVTELSEGLGITWNYNTDLFSHDTIRGMAEHFSHLLEQLLQNPDKDVFTVDLLNQRQLQQQVLQWNDTQIDYQDDLCIHQLFEAQAARTPDAVALVFEDTELTYAELNHKANQLALHLVENYQITADTLVGICVERSMEMMISLLAILKAGGAYVPMDPGYPANRLAHILADSGIRYLLTQTDILPMFELDDSVMVICIDTKSLIRDDEDVANIAIENPALRSSSLAYMIYTSGSTGNPKGVMVSHKNALNFFTGLNQTLGQSEHQATWLAVTSISFDISVLELLWTLSQGNKIVIQPDRPADISQPCELDISLFYFAAEESKSGVNKYELLLEGAKFADKNGLSGVWVPERHFANFGDQFPNPSVAAAAVAALTDNIAIRAGSVVLPLHDPIRVAEEWSMVDNLSNGRVEVAIASGWHPNDFVFVPEVFETRHQVMRDNLNIVQNLWRGESIKRTNGQGKEVDIQLHPSPIQANMPTWITAATSPVTFEYAGSIGANVLTHLLGHSIEELGEKIKLYRDALEKAGFDREQGKVALMLHTFVSDDPDIKEIVREPLKNYLRHSLHLIKSLVEGTEVDEGVDWEKDPEVVLEFAFQRYYQSFGLFGSVQACQTKVAEFTAIGVNEVASLIDFGIDNHTVLASLPYLASLQKLCKQGSARQKLLSKRLLREWSPLALIKKYNVTHMQCTPSFINDWVNNQDGQQGLNQLKMLLVGGEAIAPGVASKLVEHVSGVIYNMYGPTETTIWSAIDRIDSSDVRIGLPMANTRFYILDRQHQLVPDGIVGELCIAGDGVAGGYFNRHELTMSQFITDPFTSGDSEIMYKTGDLVQRSADGRLRFLGRLDEQIKFNGFRIELGEIEHYINEFDGVDSSFILAHKNDNDKRTLVAYIRMKDGQANVEQHTLADRLRQYLATQVPDFMIPAVFVLVAHWPLTPNGKLDKRALPALDGQQSGARHIEPDGETEKALAEIWYGVLQLETGKISAMGNFFNLGGHSLLSLRLVADICKQFAIEIDVRAVFEAPVLRDMALVIDRALLVMKSAALTDEEVEVEGWL
ncbi:MupA/Atu3671 family FMN-dependent luciferase-like monooxygenase [Colwellia psychrerythraea]|uniref:Natural product biosynthesis luciferase-like monooxygenase domain containing protein n=1 Tax=Colwellia psychrerythraea TaxID=28229 RepID=A0A099K8T5_COLPS|nr:MupA/Atu3671 family FMN-dependent luciferase-like monooxygenase [Colwellia psychrerythraea]KGJ86781.1 Natural product biosynthesis luciferase-like monooxygenase domain containing protein [Colwellia psychrerythraea]